MVERMEVILKKRFQSKVDKLLFYLEQEFGKKGIDTFRRSLLSGLEINKKKFPESGAPTILENVRSFRAGKHIRVYYKVKGNQLIILNMYDLRQDPSKNIFK
jgi:plasmid stabilization system protein ParE